MAATSAGQVAGSRRRGTCITFLSDYGLQDEFVAVCKGVIRRIAPDTEILDITHCIEPFALRHGAQVLARTVAFMPVAVHLAIVDPTVGSSRRPIAVRTADGSMFVAPDNGLIGDAVRARGGPDGAWEIANPQVMLSEVSQTFHGRDIFAPAAAHLAIGRPPEDLGDAVDLDSLVVLPEPPVVPHGDHVHAEVVAVDRFGNVQLGLTARRLAEMLGAREGDVLEVVIGGRSITLVRGSHFSAVGPQQPVLIADSSGHAALAVNQGSFADMAGSRPGDQVVLGLSGGNAGSCASDIGKGTEGH